VLKGLRLTVVAASLLTASSGCGVHHDVTRGPSDSAAPAARNSRPTRAPSPGAGCNEAAALKTWSLERRAAQLVVVPVEEDAVRSARPLVAEGIGGIILFGSQAPAGHGR
jgi:hypothetical protein